MATPVDISIILAAQAGDTDAMWTVLELHEPFMKSLVRTVAPAANAEESEDLLQEARVALMERLRDYSTDAPASLATYARSAVQRAVSSYYLKSSSQLSIEPSTAIAVKHALWVAEGNADRAWSIVEATGSMSRERFVSMCEAFVDADSLDAPIGDSEDALTLADVTEDTSLDAMDPTERRDTARRLLEVIKPRQSYALRAYYGIRMTPLTDEQASDELGLSGRGKSAALRQLRQRGINSARTQAARFGIAA
ncbi:sigma factor [Streptomyces sp. NPDC058542]|uniref:sigma factor n=1 Tax=Streptomyces sp. NPDC058542 TaxID=3346543 RepID=UPI003665CD2F